MIKIILKTPSFALMLFSLLYVSFYLISNINIFMSPLSLKLGDIVILSLSIFVLINSSVNTFNPKIVTLITELIIIFSLSVFSIFIMEIMNVNQDKINENPLFMFILIDDHVVNFNFDKEGKWLYSSLVNYKFLLLSIFISASYFFRLKEIYCKNNKKSNFNEKTIQ